MKLSSGEGPSSSRRYPKTSRKALRRMSSPALGLDTCCGSPDIRCLRAEQTRQSILGLVSPTTLDTPQELRPKPEHSSWVRDVMEHGLGSTPTPQTLWPSPPATKQANTFVVDAKVALGEADVVVLVLGAPGTRQRRLVLVDRGIQALQAPAQFLLPWGRQPASSAPAGGVSNLQVPSSQVRRRRRHLGGSCYCVTGGGEKRDQIRLFQPMASEPTWAAGKPSPSLAPLLRNHYASPHFGLHFPQCRALQGRTSLGS